MEGIRCGLAGGRRRATAPHAACRTADWGQGMGEAHPEHVAHVRDAGGVKAQRLVERRRVVPSVFPRLVEPRRALPSRKEGMRCRARCVLFDGGHGAATAQAARRAVPSEGRGSAHVRDPGGVPAGNVRVEILQISEELSHVGDGRDAPLGDGAVLRNGGSRVSVERLDRRLQGALGREGVGPVGAGLRQQAGRWRRRRRCRRRWRGRRRWRAWRWRRWRRRRQARRVVWGARTGPRSPVRVIALTAAVAAQGFRWGARPRATNEQFVGVGQGVCALPSRKEGIRCGAGREAKGVGRQHLKERAEKGSTAYRGQGAGRSALGTSRSCL
eukprot:scaffold26019_cov69-Phaeocystis_antarctica.AAC.2